MIKILFSITPIVLCLNSVLYLNLNDLNLRLGDFLFLFLFIYSLFKMKKINIYYLILILSLIIIFLFNNIFTINYEFLNKFLRMIETLLWGFIGLVLCKNKNQLDSLLKCVLYAGVILAVYSIYIFLDNPNLHRIASFLSYADGDGLDTQASYNEVGAFFVICIVITLQNIINFNSIIIRYSTIIILLFGLILTQSRSAFLSIFIILLLKLIYYIRESMDYKKIIYLIFNTISILIIWIWISSLMVLDRISESIVFSSNAFESASTRFDFWIAAQNLIFSDFSSFFFGYGVEFFKYNFEAASIENFFLDITFYYGFITLLIVMYIISKPIINVFKIKNYSQLNLLSLFIFLVAMTVSVTGNVLVDPFFGGVSILLLYSINNFSYEKFKF